LEFGCTGVVIIDWRYYFTNSKSKNRINAYLIPRDGFKFLCKIDTTTPACYSQTIFMVIDSTLAAFIGYFWANVLTVPIPQTSNFFLIETGLPHRGNIGGLLLGLRPRGCRRCRHYKLHRNDMTSRRACSCPH